jgi:pimeloyl-ACP methyl ester carboxylesterase
MWSFRVGFAVILAALWLGLALGIVGLFYRPNIQIPEDLPGKAVDVAGVSLRVWQSGQGRDVLLIHGSPGSIEDWTQLKRVLEGSYRVTAYDRPGHGWSGDTGVYSPTSNADSALALLDTLDLHDVIVVGHSYGGAIALNMALRRPSRVSAYVLLDSAVYTPAREPDPTMHLLSWPYVGVGSASLLGTFVAPLLIRKGLEKAFGPRGHGPDEAFIALRTRIWSTPKVLHAVALESLRAREALAAQSPRYPQIQQPVVILSQTTDPLRRANAERLHAAIPSSTLTLLSDTGHYLQLEKTRECAEAVTMLDESTPLLVP